MTHDLLQDNYPEWDLSDLYAHDQDPCIEEDWQKSEQEAAAFKHKYEGFFLNTFWTGADLYDALKTYESISERLGRLGSYAGLRYYKNVKDQEALTLFQATQERSTKIGQFFIFFTLDLNEIDQNALDQAYETYAALAHYKPWLDNVRHFKPHQLSPDVEKVFMEKAITSSRAFIRLYDKTLAAMTFNVDGNTVSLSGVTECMGDPNPVKRRQAAIALSEELTKKESLFSFITNTLAKDKATEDEWRHFKTPMAARHLDNQIESDVIDALESAVVAQYTTLSHRYYALKAKMMGLSTLNYWDRNAPLSDDDTRYTWLEARRIVFNAYQAFSPHIASIASQFFENNWIDVPPTDGKTSGAFSHPTVPSAHPYILVNFQQRKRDVMTLAHELGHGIHQVLSKDQGYLLADTPLTLAETASVFGEMLTFNYLVTQAKTPLEKRQMLASKIEDMLNTAVRQIAFYRFEKRVHTMRATGELSVQTLHNIWIETQTEA
jgi:oligoendopeptidase F